MQWLVSTSVVDIRLIMNFFPVPPTIQAELFVRIPDEVRCIGEATDWKAASSLGALQDIFLEVSMKSCILHVALLRLSRVLWPMNKVSM
jgi:hypothetical protein